MSLFEGYERRIDQINEVCKKYGIASIEEAKTICDEKGVKAYDIVGDLQPIAFAINAFGHWRWTHPKAGEESAKDASALKVSKLSMRGWCLALTIVTVAGAIWGYVLSQLGTTWWKDTFSPDPTPWLDSFVLMLTLLAQFLSAQKKWDCWIVWLIVNAANITLYLSAGLVFMPIVSALYLANGIWSLWTWFKLYREGK